jgi:hypothetical protein
VIFRPLTVARGWLGMLTADPVYPDFRLSEGFL